MMTTTIEIPTSPTSPTDILAVAKSGDSEAMLEWVREQGKISPFFFSSCIAGYHELTKELHEPVCQWLVDTEAVRGRGLLFPRKYFKSSMVKGYVLRRIVANPDIRVLFVGENEMVGSKNLQDIKWNIQQNKFFQALYPHVIPADYGKSWSESAITVPRSKSFDEPTIQTIGIGAKHTGFHYDLIIYDDPIGLVAAKSRAEMLRAIEWFQAAPGLLDSVDSEELYVGTRWKHGKGDLPGWIMKKMPYRVVDGHKSGYVWMVRSAIEDGKSIFPPEIAPSGKRIGYSLRDLGEMRKRQGNYLFNANMLNQPTAEEGADFAEDWIKTYHINEDRKTITLLDTNERLELNQLVRLSVYDPSSGGKTAEAENGIVVIGTDFKGRIIVLDNWSQNCGFHHSIEQWHRMNDHWQCWHNWFEAVGAHKEVGEQTIHRENPCKQCGKIHRKIRPRPIIPPPGSKEDRIRDLAQPAFEEGRVYLGEGMTKLRRQITDFPHGYMVDLFDALAYAISKARKPVIRDEDREVRAKLERERRATRGQRVYTTTVYGGYI